MTLALWLDPADPVQVTLSGSRITDVADKSDEGNDVSEITASGPEQGAAAVNGLDTMQFATTDRLELASGSITGMTADQFTVIAVAQDDGSVGANNMLASRRDNLWDGDTKGWGLTKVSTEANISFSVGLWTANEVNMASTDSLGDMQIFSGMYDGVNDYLEAHKNGAFAGADNHTGTLTYAWPLRIGYIPSSPEAWLDGDMGDVIFYDRKLRSDERQRVEGYLAAKWDILNSLPAGHPYKEFAPTVEVTAELIINFSGADGDTTYTAETGQTVTFVANAVLDDVAPRFGMTSLLLDGTGDSVHVPDSADFELGAGDFTLEGWVAPDTATPVEYDILSKYDANDVNRSFIMGFGAGSELRFSWSTDGTAVTTRLTTDAPAIVIGEFVHVAVCRIGDVLHGFINGVELTWDNSAVTGTLFDSNANVHIGDRESGSGDFGGRIDSVRLVKGSALYPRAFDPPRRPFAEPPTAPFIANFNDGVDAVTAYTSEDASARTATFVSAAVLDTAQAKFGISSADFNNSTGRITFPHDDAFRLLNAEFTVQCWVRFDNAPSPTDDHVFFGHYDSGANERGWQIGLINQELRFGYSTDGTNPTFVSLATPWVPAVDTWYHIAAIRDSDKRIQLFVDGVMLDEFDADVTIFAATSVLLVGGHLTGTQVMDGWIDGIQIVNGTNLWGVNNLPPVQEYVSDSSLRLLANFNGADGATAYVSEDDNLFNFTFNNSAALDDAERKFGSTSVAVNATNDSVTIPSDAALTLGSGDFGIELWFRASAHTGADTIYDQRTAASQAVPVIYLNTGVLTYYVSGANRITGTTPALNEWHHVLVQRIGGTTRMYLNGLQVGADYTDATNYIGNAVSLGDNNSWATSNGLEGWIDGVRVKVGSPLYGGDFDPPVDGAGEPITDNV